MGSPTADETVDAGVSLAHSGADTFGDTIRQEAPKTLRKGQTIGRYVVLRTLGAGGMGTVYLGYDPQLDRRVALKLLRGTTSAKKRLALQREAQAMAKLAHPNVVTVHDVGEHDGRTYMAMEFVRGHTLAHWLGVQRRPWREVLEIFLHAGRGLGAAHAEELIHRDFKPDNVMVSDEGRVLVMDFGLARTSSAASQNGSSMSASAPASAPLTAATHGRLAGTPAYMAPEQVAAEDVSPATDQFSFCVSVWEGVCGQRPFAGETTIELLASICEGRIQPPPSDACMPRWLERVLRRGLALEAKDRWSSMASLMAALERGRGRWRWQVGLGVLALVLAGVGVMIGWQRQRTREDQQRVAMCEAEGAAIDEAWNEAQRARLESGLLATKVGFARDSVDTLIPVLDEYADAWRSGRAEACTHHSIEHDWDADLLDRSAWCFEDRRIRLEATVEQIATLDRAGARRAVRLVSYLDPVSACLDPVVLERLPAPAREQRDDIRSIWVILAQAERLRYRGKYRAAIDVAQLGRTRAEVLGWPPLLVAARLTEGKNLHTTGRLGEAEVVLTTGYFEAQRAGSVEVAFRAARGLMRVLVDLQRHREGELWARHAAVLSSELTDLSGLDEAEGHYLRMGLLRGVGDYDAAAMHGESAVAMRTEALGAEHPITAAATRNLGIAYLDQGRALEALELFESSVVIWEDAVGHEHPYIAQLARYRAQALLALGRVDEALTSQQASLAIDQRVLPTEHPTIALDLIWLGRIYGAMGRLDEAEQAIGRALTSQRKRLGVRHQLIAEGLLSMAIIDLEDGRLELALERCSEALEMLELLLEPGHPRVSVALEQSADVVVAMGRLDDAERRRREALARRESVRGRGERQLMTPLVQLGDLSLARAEHGAARGFYTRALAIGEAVSGRREYVLVPSLVGLAELSLAEGNVPSALRWARRAVQIAEDERAGPRVSAGAHFALARALVAGVGPSQRARSLAKMAVDEYAMTHDAARRREVEAWVAGMDGDAQ